MAIFLSLNILYVSYVSFLRERDTSFDYKLKEEHYGSTLRNTRIYCGS